MRRRSTLWLRVLSIFFIAFSALLLAVYGWFVWDQATNGIEADATIFERVVEGSVELVVEFTTEDGQRVRTDFREYSRPESHGVGDTIRIRYVPRDPRIARQADEPVGDSGVFVTGGLFLLLGVGMASYAWRHEPNDPLRGDDLSPGRRGA